ncbi:MAG: iron-containing alcohol dehydrogenase [Chlorobiaceae bacterium]|nr:iron-containing alcohol dehydrogenase [Chlorobiaceae bacterium]
MSTVIPQAVNPLSQLNEFSILPLPSIFFGPGRFFRLPELALKFGGNALVVTGRNALERSGKFRHLEESLLNAGIEAFRVSVDREPSPELVNQTVSLYRECNIDVVIAVGGGSALDAGKAVSATLLQQLPVERFIEGQDGFLPHDGKKVPFIAVPTTSGTGSEVTNNAVISRVGEKGFKRSLRHQAFVPDIALIDPDLMTSVPRDLSAASGMDACTQLLEAYLSPFASPYTDALALSGLDHFSRSFIPVCTDRAGDSSSRGDIAYAALMSGIALANAGLGIVHGFASSVGGFFDIPHGTLCATLLLEATRENIRQLNALDRHHPALAKYARAGEILSGKNAGDTHSGCALLLETLGLWQELLGFPALGEFGIRESDIGRITAITRSKSNAVILGEDNMRCILEARL